MIYKKCFLVRPPTRKHFNTKTKLDMFLKNLSYSLYINLIAKLFFMVRP